MSKKILLALCATTLLAAAQAKPLAIGKTIPEGELKTVKGQAFNLLDAAKNQHLVVIFYRGGWCPYCSAHLGELQSITEDLRLLGYRIVAISPDLPENLQASLDKGPMTYTLLSDSSMKTAKAFGVAFEVDDPMLEKLASYNIDIEAASGQTHHQLPVPSVFLVGTDGKVDYVHSNADYTVRLKPEAILKAAKAASQK